MKDSATQSKAAEPIIYKSEKELFAKKRAQVDKSLSHIDPVELKLFLDRVKQKKAIQ